MAGLAAHAAWHMGQWEEMAAYTHEMRTNDTSTGSFLLAVQAVHNQNLDAAKGETFGFILIMHIVLRQHLSDWSVRRKMLLQ